MENQTTTLEMNQEVIDFAKYNANFYHLDCSYGGKYGLTPIWKDPSELTYKKAEQDFNLFQQRQKAINDRNKISEGDFIIRKDGSMERISVASHGWLQGGNIDGGSVYLSQNGIGQWSGSCGSSIEAYEATDETREGSCWIFSGDSAGAHRGVWHKLQFKVWKEI